MHAQHQPGYRGGEVFQTALCRQRSRRGSCHDGTLFFCYIIKQGLLILGCWGITAGLSLSRTEAGPGSLVSPESSFGTLCETRSLNEAPAARLAAMQQGAAPAVPQRPRITASGHRIPTLPPLPRFAAPSRSLPGPAFPQGSQYAAACHSVLPDGEKPLHDDRAMRGDPEAEEIVLPLDVYRRHSGTGGFGNESIGGACSAYSRGGSESGGPGASEEGGDDHAGARDEKSEPEAETGPVEIDPGLWSPTVSGVSLDGWRSSVGDADHMEGPGFAVPGYPVPGSWRPGGDGGGADAAAHLAARSGGPLIELSHRFTIGFFGVDCGLIALKDRVNLTG
jgi:hypothetical protein